MWSDFVFVILLGIFVPRIALVQASTTTAGDDEQACERRLEILGQGVVTEKKTVRSQKTGECVNKPWSDFESCEAEAEGGTCYDGNTWVSEHCCKSCGECSTDPSVARVGRMMLILVPVILICCCAIGGCICCYCKRQKQKPHAAKQQDTGGAQPQVISGQPIGGF